MDKTIKTSAAKLKLFLLLIITIPCLEKVSIAADTAAITTGASKNAAANKPVPNPENTEAESPGAPAVAAAPQKCEPAVSCVNGWVGLGIDYLHNERDSGFGGIIEGGIATPLTFNSGAQLRVFGGNNLQSIDGYIFLRDPYVGLLGPHVMYTKSTNFHDTLYGLHGEYYDDNFTLTAEGGGTSITHGHHSNNIYYEAIVNWYAKPNWKLYIGGIVVGDGAVQIGTEYLIGSCTLPNLSMFIDLGMGGHNDHYGYLGFRYYFSDACDNCNPRTLIQRHREDMVPPTLNPISKLK